MKSEKLIYCPKCNKCKPVFVSTNSDICSCVNCHIYFKRNGDLVEIETKKHDNEYVYYVDNISLYDYLKTQMKKLEEVLEEEK